MSAASFFARARELLLLHAGIEKLLLIDEEPAPNLCKRSTVRVTKDSCRADTLSSMDSKNQTIVILDNIRSMHNVGSIFRTADAVGISKIYLVGYTPKPVDRFGRPVKEIEKTALGAEKTISWEHTESLAPLLRLLKKEGFMIVAIEQSSKSVDYKKVRLGKRTALILGYEVEGLSKDTLARADTIAEIPMKGRKESLNVAVAFGVAAFRFLNP